MKTYYSIEEYKLYETDPVRLAVLDGWAVLEDGTFPVLRLFVNGQEKEYTLVRIARSEVIEKHHLDASGAMCGFRLVCMMNEPVTSVEIKTEEKTLLSVDEAAVKANTLNSGIVYYIDHTYIDENHDGSITGWAFSVDGSPLVFTVSDKDGMPIESKSRTFPRIDQPVFGKMKENRAGFQVNFKAQGDEVLSFDAGKYHDTFTFKVTGAQKAEDGLAARWFKKVNTSSLDRLRRYFRQHGFAETVKKVYNTARGIDAYHQWFTEQRTSNEDLEKQRAVTFDYAPLISIVVPTFNTPEKYLREMIGSVEKQTYSNWQLCIADGSSSDHPARKILDEYAKKDRRIKVTYLEKNYGISGNTNRALELVTGEYTGLFDHDDLMEPDMLYEIVNSLQRVRHDVIYTDEDKLNSRSGRFESPCFKPDFDLNLIRSENYITHFFTAKTDLILDAGGFHSEYDGSQDFDLTLRCIEKAKSVHHIPKVLYHWRMHGSSTAEDPTSKLYCYESGEKALRDHLGRLGIKASVKYFEDPLWGAYKVVYENSDPRISVILQNFENEEARQACIRSLYENYQNLEVLVHGRSLNEDVWMASGRYILLLDGTVPASPECLSVMAGYMEQNDVSVTAGMVTGPDGLIRHSGLITGIGSGLCDAGNGLSRYGPGYLNRSVVACEYSAVMPYAVMFERRAWNRLGGFDEGYSGNLFFADFCLRLREKGKKIVYVPYAVFKDGRKKEIKENEADMKRFCDAWRGKLENDPYYNPNFAPEKGPYQY